MSDKQIEIFVVDCSYGEVRLSSVKAAESAKTYRVDLSTQSDYFRWQYIPLRLNKGKNVFTNARDAAEYAAREIAKQIDEMQSKIDKARFDLKDLQVMLETSRKAKG